jgi:hypothetical protein
MESFSIRSKSLTQHHQSGRLAHRYSDDVALLYGECAGPLPSWGAEGWSRVDVSQFCLDKRW